MQDWWLEMVIRGVSGQRRSISSYRTSSLWTCSRFMHPAQIGGEGGGQGTMIGLGGIKGHWGVCAGGARSIQEESPIPGGGWSLSKGKQRLMGEATGRGLLRRQVSGMPPNSGRRLSGDQGVIGGPKGEIGGQEVPGGGGTHASRSSYMCRPAP